MIKQPLVLFDSGVGGTSILKEVRRILPYEDCIYLADSKNAPYGERHPEQIINLSKKNTELALSMQAKLVVVACNTATTNAIAWLRQRYDIPFIGIEPAIKPAALNSKAKCIGVLATKGTLSSKLFKQTSQNFANGTEIVEVVGKGIVEAVEGGWTHRQEFLDELKSQIQTFIDQDIDYLVLGCTHFPYIIPQLRTLLPKHIQIIDSGQAVAAQTQSILKHKGMLTTSQVKGNTTIYTNVNNIDLLDSLTKEIKPEKIQQKVF